MKNKVLKRPPLNVVQFPGTINKIKYNNIDISMKLCHSLTVIFVLHLNRGKYAKHSENVIHTHVIN
jgi:hypothetical protein